MEESNLLTRIGNNQRCKIEAKDAKLRSAKFVNENEVAASSHVVQLS